MTMPADIPPEWERDLGRADLIAWALCVVLGIALGVLAFAVGA